MQGRTLPAHHALFRAGARSLMTRLVCIVWCVFIASVPGEGKYCVSVHFEVEISGQ